MSYANLEMLYANYVIDGKRTIESVPKVLRGNVQAIVTESTSTAVPPTATEPINPVTPQEEAAKETAPTANTGVPADATTPSQA